MLFAREPKPFANATPHNPRRGDLTTTPRFRSPPLHARSSLLHFTSPPQATEQFKRDAVVLLAPFGNRIPAGVKGLDAVLGEYVAFKEADTRRKRAVASNPLAKRMYDVLEECAAGVVPASESTAPSGDATLGAAGTSKSPLKKRAELPSPSAAAMPPPPARSPHRGKKRGGAAPRRNAPAGPRAAAARDANQREPVSYAAPNVFGSLDDDSERLRTSWRNYELPRALNDARVQERLAAVIADRIPSLDEARTSEDALFAGFASSRKNNPGSSASPGPGPAARRRTSPRKKQKTLSENPSSSALPDDASGAGPSDLSPDPAEFGGLDVDEVMESLFENDADGTLGEILGPLLGMPPRSEGGAATGKPSPKKQNADPTRAKRRLRLGQNEAEKKVPAHVRALDVDAFVKSIEY